MNENINPLHVSGHKQIRKFKHIQRIANFSKKAKRNVSDIINCRPFSSKQLSQQDSYVCLSPTTKTQNGIQS